MKAAGRIAWIACLVCGLAGFSHAQTMVLKGAEGTTTGELLDGTRNLGITTNVVEISGLMITARTGNTSQQINATTTSLGINTDDISDDTDAFEAGESLVLSFDRDIRISQFDFKGFESNETFTVAVTGLPVVVISYEDLNNKSTDVFNTNIVVLAETEIELFTTGGSIIGLDGIELTVLDANVKPSLTLVPTNGMASVAVVFSEAPGTSYTLQSVGDLADSNGWQTVSAPFSSSTNWMLETTNDAIFYRVVPE